MILTFEKDDAEYFDTSHQVFAKLDSRTVEKQNQRSSVTATKYSSELKYVYGRVRVRLASVFLCIRPAICIEFRYVCTRPAVCIASVFPVTLSYYRLNTNKICRARLNKMSTGANKCQNVRWKRWVFKRFKNLSVSVVSWILSGKEFQAAGPAWLKQHSANVVR